MKKVLVALLLVIPATFYGQVNPGGYAISVHVSASRIADDCFVVNGGTMCKATQQLNALIDGSKYELQSDPFYPKGIVALGDYKAKLIKDAKSVAN